MGKIKTKGKIQKAKVKIQKAKGKNEKTKVERQKGKFMVKCYQQNKFAKKTSPTVNDGLS